MVNYLFKYLCNIYTIFRVYIREGFFFGLNYEFIKHINLRFFFDHSVPIIDKLAVFLMMNPVIV